MARIHTWRSHSHTHLVQLFSHKHKVLAKVAHAMFLALRACNLFKMFSILALLSATLFSSRVAASELPQLPARTLHAQDAFAIAGWTPKPASAPNINLFRKQDSDLSPLCGFVGGDFGSSILTGLFRKVVLLIHLFHSTNPLLHSPN